MKRFFAVQFAMLLLVPVLACGAAAAESYIFERMPNIEYYADSVVFPSDGEKFLYWGVIPSGEYYIQALWAVDGGTGILKTVTPLSLNFSGGIVTLEDVQFEGFFNGISQGFMSVTVGYVGFDDVSALVLDGPLDDNYASILSYVELVPVDSSETIHIFDYVSQPMVDGVLNEVVALLPALLGCMIVFLGVRKGIAFIRGILHDA